VVGHRARLAPAALLHVRVFGAGRVSRPGHAEARVLDLAVLADLAMGREVMFLQATLFH
jgi:hypothetical protein